MHGRNELEAQLWQLHGSHPLFRGSSCQSPLQISPWTPPPFLCLPFHHVLTLTAALQASSLMEDFLLPFPHICLITMFVSLLQTTHWGPLSHGHLLCYRIPPSPVIMSLFMPGPAEGKAYSCLSSQTSFQLQQCPSTSQGPQGLSSNID